MYITGGDSVPNYSELLFLEATVYLLCLSSSYPFPAFLCITLLITGAGADFVMLGGMFAGHDQCAGEIIEKNGKKVKLFYGMSSDTAMKKHSGGVAEYRYEFHTRAIALNRCPVTFGAELCKGHLLETGPCFFLFRKMLLTQQQI